MLAMHMQVLGDNLLALIKAYDYNGIPIPAVRRIARQVLVAMDYLHTTCHIIHTDLKPENIMLTQTLRPRKWLPTPSAPGPGPSRLGNGECFTSERPILGSHRHMCVDTTYTQQGIVFTCINVHHVRSCSDQASLLIG